MELDVLLNKKKGDTLNAEEQQFVDKIKDYVYKLIKNVEVDEFNYEKAYAYAKLAKFGIIRDKKKTIDFIFESILYNGLFDYDVETLFKTYPILSNYVDNVLDALNLNQLEALSSYYYTKEEYTNYFKVCNAGANYEPRGLLGGFKLVNTLIRIDSFKYQTAYCYIYGLGTKPNYVKAFKLFLNYRRDHLVFKNGVDNFTEDDLAYLYNKLEEDILAGKKYPGLPYALSVMNREGIGTHYNPAKYKMYSEIALNYHMHRTDLTKDEYEDDMLIWKYVKDHTINNEIGGDIINNLCNLDNIEVGKYIELGKYDHRSILWKVLDIKDGKALLLSTSILDNIYPIVDKCGNLFDSSIEYFKYKIKFENKIKFELKYLTKDEIDKYLGENKLCYSRKQSQINGFERSGVADVEGYSYWFVNNIDDNTFIMCIDPDGEYDSCFEDDTFAGFRPAMVIDLAKDEE